MSPFASVFLVSAAFKLSALLTALVAGVVVAGVAALAGVVAATVVSTTATGALPSVEITRLASTKFA